MLKKHLEENKTALEKSLKSIEIEIVEESLELGSVNPIHDYISDLALELYDFDEFGTGFYSFDDNEGFYSSEIDDIKEEYDYVYKVRVRDHGALDEGCGYFHVNFHVRFGSNNIDLEVFSKRKSDNEFFGDIHSSELSSLVKTFLTMKALYDLDKKDVLKSAKNINLSFGTSEKHFKSSAKRFKKELESFLNKKNGVSDSKVSLSESQQLLSLSLFGKPFQESKVNILNNQEHTIHKN